MHELGLCEGIVDAVARRAGDRPVARVRVRVGAFHHVHPEAFAQSFALASTGTVAEGAEAELVLLPVTARCRACATTVESAEPVLSCPACGELELDHAGGDELLLESLEYRG
ncbi:MAG TPA: hydrogenase maturation nickel metallochaperone HypA [Acidimicrobiales bacterium]|nr:hydrogenase maturation nickel metallochaperone HypA [Acidimicrobiales bacterium]